MAKKYDGDLPERYADQARRFIESGKKRRTNAGNDGDARLLDLDSARKRRAVRRVKEKDPKARDEK